MIELGALHLASALLLIVVGQSSVSGCQFYPPGEYLRFVRVPENLRVGEEVLKIEVHPRRNLKLQAVDKNDDVHYFSYQDVNKTTISLLLARSIDDLVDTESPQNVLKFKLVCDYEDGEDTISSSLSITVYVEDINDHAPVFSGIPYHVTVDELTPVGLNIFRRIRATDRDKPNTPNSDVQYAITAGNERGKFVLDSSHQAFLLLNKPLDYDAGDREFSITITASDRGVPPKSTNATVKITVKDADDLSPKFTKGVYRTKIPEFYPLTGEKIHHRLNFDPPIHAFDQDLSIDSPIRYDILAGNDRHLFYLDHENGSLFLVREVDLDTERALPGNTFVLQIQASQVDNLLKTGVARVELEVTDLNDNLPEFEVDFYNISIVENLPNGFSVLQIVATDQDQGDNAEFNYELDDLTNAFSIDSHNGWLTVKDHTILDREKRSTINMRVYAKEKAPSVVTSNQGMSSVPVEVTLLDANDNNPTFIPGNIYEFSLNINSSRTGDVFGQVHAIDPDLGKNGLVSYHIQKSANNSMFKIDPRTGQLFVNEPLKKIARYTLLVEATDQPVNPSERRFSLAVVNIDVRTAISKEANVDVPDFIGAPYEFWVGGNVDIGTSVGQIRITNEKPNFMYDLLHSYRDGVPFAVEEKSGTITVVDDLTRYKRTNYDFEAVVTNAKDMSIVTNVTIHVVNPDDDKVILMKHRENKTVEFHVKENQADVLIGKLAYSNVTSNFIKFSIANQRDVTDYIAISSDGSLYTQKPLDREKNDVYKLTVIVESIGTIAIPTGIYQVTVYVDDENDNSPEFEHLTYEGRIHENCKSGTEVDLNYPIKANDLDVGVNGQVNYKVVGDGSEMFRLEKYTGKLYFQSRMSKLDREQKPVYNFQLVAKDKGELHGEAKLTIKVEDENDNAPKFTELIIASDLDIEVLEYGDAKSPVVIYQEHRSNSTTGVYTMTQTQLRYKGGQSKSGNMFPLFAVNEDTSVGTPILRLVAEDLDLGANAVVRYQMSSETYIPKVHMVDPFHVAQYLMVHPSNGEIAIARSLPPESEFRLNITALDIGDLRDNITVRIYVRDVNNHSPVFVKSWYTFDTDETSYSKKYLGKIEANDADFGQNANISYSILTTDKLQNLPFTIGKFSGILSTNGELDREKNDKYSFVVVASDNPIRQMRLSSSVTVEVNVLDVNDNAPEFYGYDDKMLVNIQDLDRHRSHAFSEPIQVPVYYASVSENSPVDTTVGRVFANDSDFAGNGNGLILFSIAQRKNRESPFAIDSKEGIITTTGQLDYERQKSYNVTVIASDLGSPSLNAIAVVTVNVLDVQEDMAKEERPVFAHRYYEIEVEENVPVPLKLLTLNVTEEFKRYRLKYSIVADKGDEVRKTFKIDPRNGTIFITKPLDRETKSLYELRVRVDEYKVGRDMTVMVYPISNEKMGDYGSNEVKVVVRVTDTNDNIPKFTIVGRPIIAAIPINANYGYQIIRLQAKDPDLGLNGEIRYQILGRVDDETHRFAIDSVTGQVRAIASFAKDAGRVYGFDVKATDRRGADDGKSAIANVFVYVLDDEKQLVMVVGKKPLEVEKSMDNITGILYNSTGFDIRVRKLEPHTDRNHVDNSATDMYLYAVDPSLNVIVPTEKLQKILHSKQPEIERNLETFKVLALASGYSERVHSRNQRVLLSTLEIGVVILGSIVFIGALATAICVVCVRRRKKSLVRKNFTHAQTLGYTIAAANGKPSLLFPATSATTYAEGFQYTEPVLDLVPQPTGFQLQLERYPEHSSKRSVRTRSRSAGGGVSGGTAETSITSLNSSGQDSGIVDGGMTMMCPCGQSSTQTSEESNNSSSYEDSLNSEARLKLQEAQKSGRCPQQRRIRNRSLSDGTNSLRIRQDQVVEHDPYPQRSYVNPGYLLPGHLPIRRSADRGFAPRT